MPTQTTNLFLLEDLEDVGRTSELAKSDLDALQAVAEWIKTYVVKPHKDLGRSGPVCPFVPGALERKTFWLAPERIAARDVPAVVKVLNGYKRSLLDARPAAGDEAKYKVIVVVFTDLSPHRDQRLEVLRGGGLARIVGAALWRVSRPRARSRATPVAMAGALRVRIRRAAITAS